MIEVQGLLAEHLACLRDEVPRAHVVREVLEAELVRLSTAENDLSLVFFDQVSAAIRSASDNPSAVHALSILASSVAKQDVAPSEVVVTSAPIASDGNSLSERKRLGPRR